MKWLCLILALLLPAESAIYEPRQSPAHWPGGRADRIPRPEAGVCPGGFEAWRYDKQRAAICVRRA